MAKYKPEDEMYEILHLIGQGDVVGDAEHVVVKTTNYTYKNRIVDAINNELGSEYSVLDLFCNVDPKHGGLHPLGHRLLKDKYTFHSADLNKFDNTLMEFSQLTKIMVGSLFYLRQNNKGGATLYCTDDFYTSILILSDGDFKAFCEMAQNTK